MDFTFEESNEILDAIPEYTDKHFNENNRGRAYKRVQRRNKIHYRMKESKDVFNIDVEYIDPNQNIFRNGIKFYGGFGKLHPGCQHAKCKICHYGKVFKLPSVKEEKANEKFKYDMNTYMKGTY